MIARLLTARLFGQHRAAAAGQRGVCQAQRSSAGSGRHGSTIAPGPGAPAPWWAVGRFVLLCTRRSTAFLIAAVVWAVPAVAQLTFPQVPPSLCLSPVTTPNYNFAERSGPRIGSLYATPPQAVPIEGFVVGTAAQYVSEVLRFYIPYGEPGTIYHTHCRTQFGIKFRSVPPGITPTTGGPLSRDYSDSVVVFFEFGGVWDDTPLPDNIRLLDAITWPANLGAYWNIGPYEWQVSRIAICLNTLQTLADCLAGVSSPDPTPPGASPSAPAITNVSPGNGSISVSFSPPTNPGSSPVIDFTATCGSASATANLSPITVTGLTNGRSYTCTVAARNANGTSTPSQPSPPVTVSGSSRVTLSISFAGSYGANGRIVSVPGGIDCGRNSTAAIAAGGGERHNLCSASFATGSTVRLLIFVNGAEPSRVSMDGWTGGCVGTDEGSVFMNGNKSCVAYFNSVENMLVNGTFESGPTGWTQSAPRGSIIIDGTNSAGQQASFMGTWHANFGFAGAGSYTMYQDVDVPAGRVSHLTYWYRAYHDPSPARAVSVVSVTVEAPSGETYLDSIFADREMKDWTPSPPYDMSRFAGQRVRVRLKGDIGFAGAFNKPQIMFDEIRLVSLPLETSAENYTGLWWNSQESGWGLSLAHQDTTIFGALFTHDLSGRPLWLVMPAGIQDGTIFRGDLYSVTGSPFNAVPFIPIGDANVTRVGTMSIQFSGTGATLSYSVNGSSVTKAITRQLFSSRQGKCSIPAETGGSSSLTGLWWNPAESGWGISFAQQEETVFATLFTYGLDGRPTWFVMPDGRRRDIDKRYGTYQGDLFQVATGSPFNANPYVPFAPASLQRVGTMTIDQVNYRAAEEIELSYSVNGLVVTKRISRQVFDGLPPVCGI